MYTQSYACGKEAQHSTFCEPTCTCTCFYFSFFLASVLYTLSMDEYTERQQSNLYMYMIHHSVAVIVCRDKMHFISTYNNSPPVKCRE